MGKALGLSEFSFVVWKMRTEFPTCTFDIRFTLGKRNCSVKLYTNYHYLCHSLLPAHNDEG